MLGCFCHVVKHVIDLETLKEGTNLSANILEQVLYVLPDEGVPHNTVMVLLYNALELLYVTALVRTERD